MEACRCSLFSDQIYLEKTVIFESSFSSEKMKLKQEEKKKCFFFVGQENPRASNNDSRVIVFARSYGDHEEFTAKDFQFEWIEDAFVLPVVKSSRTKGSAVIAFAFSQTLFAVCDSCNLQRSKNACDEAFARTSFGNTKECVISRWSLVQIPQSNFWIFSSKILTQTIWAGMGSIWPTLTLTLAPFFKIVIMSDQDSTSSKAFIDQQGNIWIEGFAFSVQIYQSIIQLVRFEASVRAFVHKNPSLLKQA